MREDVSVQDLLGPGLRLAHCYLCTFFWSKHVRSPALLDLRVGAGLGRWTCHITLQGMCIEKVGSWGPVSKQSTISGVKWFLVEGLDAFRKEWTTDLIKMINALITQVMVVASGGNMYAPPQRLMRVLGDGRDVGHLARTQWLYAQLHLWCQLQEQRGQHLTVWLRARWGECGGRTKDRQCAINWYPSRECDSVPCSGGNGGSDSSTQMTCGFELSLQ